MQTPKIKLLFKGLFIGSVIGAGVASLALARYFASRIITPLQNPKQPLKVLDITFGVFGRQVTLSAGEDVDLAGKYSFIFDGGAGHARLGDIISRSKDSVTRVLDSELTGKIEKFSRGKITGWWYANPEDLGLEYTDVEVPSDVGMLPGWLIESGEPATKKLILHVHGRASRREETLRGVAVAAVSGYDSLVIGYRGDPDSPAAKDGKYGLGSTEATDVIAALRFAAGLGYEEFTLFGWSMGATAVLLAVAELQRNHDQLAANITSLILESPAVNWPQILKHQAALAKLPGWIATLGQLILEKFPAAVALDEAIPVSKFTPAHFANVLTTPTLIIVSPHDTFVPAAGALELAQISADKVTLFNASQGEHVKIWNTLPEAWEKAVSDFLSEQV